MADPFGIDHLVDPSAAGILAAGGGIPQAQGFGASKPGMVPVRRNAGPDCQSIGFAGYFLFLADPDRCGNTFVWT